MRRGPATSGWTDSGIFAEADGPGLPDIGRIRHEGVSCGCVLTGSRTGMDIGIIGVIGVSADMTR